LSAGYGRTLDWNKRDGGTGTRSVHDEAVVLEDGVPHSLDNAGVIAGSIVVTDLAGLVTYVENFDYEVIEQGNHPGLRWVAGGTAPNGETVLVDYETQFTTGIEYLTDRQSAHIRYEFERYLKGLALYYRWQELAARDAPVQDDYSILEYEEWLAGMQYRCAG
jgi:hypothetical protein